MAVSGDRMVLGFRLKWHDGLQPLMVPCGSEVLAVDAPGRGYDTEILFECPADIHEHELRQFQNFRRGERIADSRLKFVGKFHMGEHAPVTLVYEQVSPVMAAR